METLAVTIGVSSDCALREPFLKYDDDGAKVVAIYNSHTDAEAAIKGLKDSGIDMKRLSIVGKDYRTEDHVVGFYNTGGSLKYWGKLGAFWGGIWRLLAGEAFFWMPGVGPILVGGPLVSSIVCALEGATVHNGVTALGSALYTMGIPKNSVINYESALKANKFLLVVHGANGEASKANEIFRKTEPIDIWPGHRRCLHWPISTKSDASCPRPGRGLSLMLGKDTATFSNLYPHGVFGSSTNGFPSWTSPVRPRSPALREPSTMSGGSFCASRPRSAALAW